MASEDEFMAGGDVKPKLAKKEEMSFSLEPSAYELAPNDRSVGWNGSSRNPIDAEQAKDLLRSDKHLRRAYYQQETKVKKAKTADVQPPDYPINWHAMCSGVHDLDVKGIYKEHEREQKKRTLQRRVTEENAGDLLDEPKAVLSDADAEAEIKRLEDEAKLRASHATKKKTAEWEAKLRTLRVQKNEDIKVRGDTKHVLQLALYRQGLAQGKVRSSDHYFDLLMQDTTTNGVKEKVALNRSCSLMESYITTTKNEVKDMLTEAAAEQKVLSTTPRTESRTESVAAGSNK